MLRCAQDDKASFQTISEESHINVSPYL